MFDKFCLTSMLQSISSTLLLQNNVFHHRPSSAQHGTIFRNPPHEGSTFKPQFLVTNWSNKKQNRIVEWEKPATQSNGSCRIPTPVSHQSIIVPAQNKVLKDSPANQGIRNPPMLHVRRQGRAPGGPTVISHLRFSKNTSYRKWSSIRRRRVSFPHVSIVKVKTRPFWYWYYQHYSGGAHLIPLANHYFFKWWGERKDLSYRSILHTPSYV